jgi:predicted DNA-binding protein
MKLLGVWLPGEEHDDLKKVAEESGRTLAELVRDALEALEREERTTRKQKAKIKTAKRK